MKNALIILSTVALSISLVRPPKAQAEPITTLSALGFGALCIAALAPVTKRMLKAKKLNQAVTDLQTSPTLEVLRQSIEEANLSSSDSGLTLELVEDYSKVNLDTPDGIGFQREASSRSMLSEISQHKGELVGVRYEKEEWPVFVKVKDATGGEFKGDALKLSLFVDYRFGVPGEKKLYGIFVPLSSELSAESPVGGETITRARVLGIAERVQNANRQDFPGSYNYHWFDFSRDSHSLIGLTSEKGVVLWLNGDVEGVPASLEILLKLAAAIREDSARGYSSFEEVVEARKKETDDDSSKAKFGLGPGVVP